jgi:hypothetical protein
MKIKTAAIVFSSLIAGSLASSAATFVLANLTGGPGADTLFANADSSPMTSGTVAIGYFGIGVTIDDVNTVSGLFSNLGSFTSVQAATPGQSVAFAGAGYLLEDLVDVGNITGTNTLIGRSVYVVMTDAASLASATLTSQWGLFIVDTIKDDVPVPNQYTGNPLGAIPVIGTPGSFNDTENITGIGPGVFSTYNMVPEPSAALLGALGALGLLRRRRI